MFTMMELVNEHVGNTAMKFINWMNSKYDAVLSGVRAPFGRRLVQRIQLEPVSLVEIEDEVPQCIMVNLPMLKTED